MSDRQRFRSISVVVFVFAMTLVVLAFVASFPPAAMRHAAAQNQAAQNQAPAEPPEVLFAIPFAVPYAAPGNAAPGNAAPGNEAATAKVVLRGLRLDNPTEVRVSLSNSAASSGSAAASAKIESSGAAAVPDKYDPKRVGDRQVEIALTMPGEPPVDGRLELRVVTAAGVSQPYRILVDTGARAVEEKEPNDGFEKAQPLDLPTGTPTKLDGSIHEPRNVDVYRFEGRAGERFRGELIAARQGGPLDAFATLFDEFGNVVFQSDDSESADSATGAVESTAAGGVGAAGNANAAGGPVTSPDPRWDTVLPRAGRYYLSLQDAHDRGSVLHRYRLILEKR